MPRNEAVVAAIQQQVAVFWFGVRHGIEPPPDFEKDVAAIGRLYVSAEDRIADLSGDEHAAELCARLLDASVRARLAESEKDAARAELLTMIGTAKAASAMGYRISAPSIPASQGRLIVPELVGTYIGGKAGHRRITVKRTEDK